MYIYICVYMYICVTIQNKPAVWAARSRVNNGIFFNWRDKRIGNMVKHDTLEWFYGDKCINYCAMKETIAKTCKHIQRTRDLGDFVEKKCRSRRKCCSDSFSGLCRRVPLEFYQNHPCVLKLRHPKVVEKSRKHRQDLDSVRNLERGPPS